VIVTAGVTGDLRTLLSTTRWAKIQVVHGDQNSSLRRLQTISNIRQSATDDDAHRVSQIACLHLTLNVRPEHSRINWQAAVALGIVGGQAEDLLK
jgi:hypothetical protein